MTTEASGRRRKLVVAVGVVLFLGLVLVAQRRPPPNVEQVGEVEPPPPAPVGVALVNGQPLTESSLLRALGERVDLSRLRPEQRAKRGAELVEELIKTFDRWQVERAFDRCVYAMLADQVITQAKVKVSVADVDARYEAERRAYEQTDDGKQIGYEDYLSQQGRTPQDRKRELYRDAGLDQVIDPPSEKALRVHFASLRPHYEGSKVKLRHILVKDKAAAVALLIRLAEGADFGALAREHSIEHDTARRGGEVTWISRRGDVPEPLAALAFRLPMGRAGGPVKTIYGWHVIQVDGVRPGLLAEVTFQAYRDRVRKDLMKQRRVRLMVHRRKHARIQKSW